MAGTAPREAERTETNVRAANAKEKADSEPQRRAGMCGGVHVDESAGG